MQTRFSFDLGTNSIGWAVLEIEQDVDTIRTKGILKSGVRIFSNSRADKTYAPLNAKRQEARSARRRRDRFLQRKMHLLETLIALGFFPKDEQAQKELQALNPYELRKNALDKRLELGEIARIFFHLNQRRGFKSNRLSEGDDDSGKIKPVIAQVEKMLEDENCRTLGEYLYKRYLKKETVRARPLTPGKTDYGLYFSRGMVKKEFDMIWNKQKELHQNKKAFSDANYEKISNIIFYQRKLKPQTVGKCLYEDEDRASWALPIAQEFRILQDLNNIRIKHNREERELNILERNLVFEWLNNKGSSAKPEDVAKQIKKLLNLEGSVHINFEKAATKVFKNNETNALMNKLLKKDKWQSFDIEKQNLLIKTLLDTELSDEETLKKLEATWGLTQEEAELCVQKINSLPKRHCNLSETALMKIAKALKDSVITYDKAVLTAGYGDHRRTHLDGYSKLPYYGEVLERYCIGKKDPQKLHYDDHTSAMTKDIDKYGKITNPTVHVGLNQLQKITNELIESYGKPQQVVIELLRDFSMGQKTKSDYDKQLKNNQENRKRIREILQKDEGIVSPSSEDILRYKLWEELGTDPADRRCPYSNEKITSKDVFVNTDIDHILPFSRTLDNSNANKVLCKSGANRNKREQSPYEAWGHDEKRWQKIEDNIVYLPHHKQWRFRKDAMEKFESNRGFLAHQLESSQYFAVRAKDFLSCLNTEDQKVDVWAVPGRLTAWLRHMWGLNSVLGNYEKNRNNHKHHAVDAIVVGCIERGVLQQVAHWASHNEGASKEMFQKKHKEKFPFLWESMREDIVSSIKNIVVSHKQDSGRSGQLLEEQAYGLLPNLAENKTEKKETRRKARYVSIQKNILDLTESMIGEVASQKTRALLLSYLERFDNDPKKAMYKCFEETGIRRVKIVKKETVIPIKNKEGVEYKGYASADNWGYEIYEEDGVWKGEIITRYDSNQKGFVPAWRKKYPAKKMIMRLHKNSNVILYPPEAPEGIIYRVCKLSLTGSGNIYTELAEVFEANDASRKEVRRRVTKLKDLQDWKMRRVHISPTGKIRIAK